MTASSKLFNGGISVHPNRRYWALRLCSALFFVGNSPVFAQPLAKPGELVAINTIEDRCYDVKPDGTEVRVPCPDVIVAIPKKDKAKLTLKFVNDMAHEGNFVKRSSLQLTAQQEVKLGGTYNCYKEDYPGHFKVVTCPDKIVLEPGAS